MDLLRIAQRPPVTVEPSSSVLEAVTLMSQNRVGAIGVIEQGRLIGIFSERDVMERVVLAGRDSGQTKISEVMTSPVETASASDDPEAALERMLEHHIRHLPITDGSDKIIGMLSIRNLLQDQLERTRSDADALGAFLSADGPGG